MIANATTTVDVTKTVGEVMGILGKLGASSITTRYDAGQPCGIGFELSVAGTGRHFELPVQIAGVRKALDREASPKYRTDAQAARVAWRIAKDWLRMQAALIEARMVALDEVMLPWLLVPGQDEGDGPRTLHAAYRAQQLALGAGS